MSFKGSENCPVVVVYALCTEINLVRERVAFKRGVFIPEFIIWMQYGLLCMRSYIQIYCYKYIQIDTVTHKYIELQHNT